MSKKQNPPSYKEWQNLSIETRMKIGWIIFKDTTWKRIENKLTEKIQKIDVWTLSPLAFIGTYRTIETVIPNHPMKYITTIGTAVMATALTLLIIRPYKKHQAHWIKQGVDHVSKFQQ